MNITINHRVKCSKYLKTELIEILSNYVTE